jgi:hypothetical protein
MRDLSALPPLVVHPPDLPAPRAAAPAEDVPVTEGYGVPLHESAWPLLWPYLNDIADGCEGGQR